MSDTTFPLRVSLEQYRKKAKNLLKAYKAADPSSVQRIRKHHPRLGKLTPANHSKARFVLADAQLVVAREHGVESWPKFVMTIRVLEAIQKGDINALNDLLRKDPNLVNASLTDNTAGRSGTRSLLHVVTDWPGGSPNGAAMVCRLVDAGADVNARFKGGKHTETPLHWAASSDDVNVLDALLDRGADIEATGAVIGGGTPLDDAVVFRQWKAARRLMERGARLKLWHMAALGLLERLEEQFHSDKIPTPDEVNHAFWSACHGGQRRAAKYLLGKGAKMNWLPPWENLTPLDAARSAEAYELVEWLRTQGAKAASELNEP